MDLGNLTLLSKIKEYQRRSDDIESYLNQYPKEWPLFQAEVSSSIDSMLLDILYFEREGKGSQVARLRKLFESRLRKYFLHGDITTWSLKKPYGYSGDFKIIDDIYINQPRTTGFDRLFDNHFLELPIAVAVRNRKQDFKDMILDFVKQHPHGEVKIMNLACGPAREIKELLEEDRQGIFAQVFFDCYDFNKDALVYAQKL